MARRPPARPAGLDAAARLGSLDAADRAAPLALPESYSWVGVGTSEAAARGCKTMNGIWMLVYQGLEAIRIWTGQDASPSVMHDAAVAALEARK